MKIEISEKAIADLDGMDKSTYAIFQKHLLKISKMPPRRHMKHGLPVNVEEVGQGRIVYRIDNESGTLYILRCFSDPKEYEKWYNSIG